MKGLFAGFAFTREIDWRGKMKFYIAFLVLLYVVATEAVGKSTVSPTLSYWHHKLPTTPLPYSLRELISPLSFAETSELLAEIKEAGHGKKVSVSIGKGGVNVGVQGKAKPKPKPVTPILAPFNYNYGAADDDIKADPSLRSIFFLEKDLHSGTKMNLQFLERSRTPDSKVLFLPRRLAEAIPFSSQKLSVALKKLDIDQGSDTAFAMETALEQCESPGIIGEKKYCATSLESMVDFSTSTLRTNNVKVLVTNVRKGQEYTITGFSFRSKAGPKSVACHKLTYAYAVYFCHETEHTSNALVSLKGEDGSHGEGVAVCHTDTSGWNPQHLAFKVLNVLPGGAPVCHFIPDDHVVWLPVN